MENPKPGRKSFYTPQMLQVSRMLAVVGELILIVSLVVRFVFMNDGSYEFTFFDDLWIVLEIADLILLGIIIINPVKIGFFATASLLMSIVCFINDEFNPMGILMFFLFFTIMNARGFYAKRKKMKIIFTVILYAVLLIPLFFLQPEELILESVYNVAGYTFVLVSILIFASKWIQNEALLSPEGNKILELSKYPGLTKRDAEWLNKIKEGVKYHSLAIDYKMSDGTVKNRVRVIYNALQCGDRLGFMNFFSDYEICFTADERLKK